jgi:hypothetical protein
VDLLLSSFMNVISVNYDEMDKDYGSAFMQLALNGVLTMKIDVANSIHESAVNF